MSLLAMLQAQSTYADSTALVLDGAVHDLDPDARGMDGAFALHHKPSISSEFSAGIARHKVSNVNWQYAKFGALWSNAEGRYGFNSRLEVGDGEAGALDFDHFSVVAGGHYRFKSAPVVLDASVQHVDSNGPKQGIGSVGLNVGVMRALWGRLQYTGAKTKGIANIADSWLIRSDYVFKSANFYLGYSIGEAAIDDVTRRLLGGAAARTETFFGGLGFPLGEHLVKLGVSHFERDSSARTSVNIQWTIPVGRGAQF